MEGSLVHPENQVLGRHVFPRGPQYTGLVIDDFFAIGRELKHEAPLNTYASQALSRARSTYAKLGMPGSDEKDVDASDRFKAAGAEVISDEAAVSAGFVSVAAPLSKRLPFGYADFAGCFFDTYLCRAGHETCRKLGFGFAVHEVLEQRG